MPFEFVNPIIPGDPQPQQYQQPVVESVPQQEVVKQEPQKDNGLGFKFTVKKSEDDNTDSHLILRSDAPVDVTKVPRKPRAKKQSDVPVAANTQEIITGTQPADVSVENAPTLYNYAQTTMLLHDTLQQTDMIASELKEELDTVRHSRTLRNKHNYIVGLSNGISQLLNTKAAIIREINNSITKSVELDYRKEKDRKSAEAAVADDKYIMDLYNSFVQNPMGSNQPNIIGPSPIEASVASVGGDSIIRSILASQNKLPNEGTPVDIGYLDYLNRLTPEQNTMFYENDPNVKTVVVFDAETGNKFFQVMNVATGQVIPNVTVLDNRFMEDTVLDIKNRIAKNNNLRQTYPIVIINEGATSQY